MRKNCERTINAWKNCKPFGKRGDSIWTDGDGIYSYNTWIVCACRDRGRYHKDGLLFNATKYSQTTTTHQNAIRAYMYNDCYDLRVYDNEPMGTLYKLQGAD